MDDNSIFNINIKDKRIIVRADLNVPMKNNRITDDTRVIRFCKGIRKLCEKGAKIIILTHLGRPKGKYDPELSTKILVDSLENNLNKKIIFSNHCTDPITLEKSKNLTNKQVLLCENLRYHKEEEENDLDFAKKLSQLGEYFVNDAFSCSHRAHASTASITAFLPSFFGPMMNEEINALNKTLEKPKRPSLAIIGGSKVSTKISVLKNLVTKLDNLIIGGGMANTFLFAKGLHVGNSIYEPLLTDTVEEINKLAKINKCQIHLPIDVIIAKELSENIEFKSVNNDQCLSEHMILDIGNKTIEHYKEIIKLSKTILWNGPLGAFETKPFNNGTNTLARFTSILTKNKNCISVAGGGDTVAALNSINVAKDFSYVSSAGGAFLEWLEGKELPGITAIKSSK